MKLLNLLCLILALLVASTHLSGAEVPNNLRTENIAAWCIVPFDAKHRSPAERAAMLDDLGIRRCAYDWRDEHVAQFEEEILQYKKHGIEYFAFWGAHEQAFKLFVKYDLHPQIWQTAGSPDAGSQEEKIAAAAKSMDALAKRTAELGCKLGLYNHDGWGGEPQNLVAVCRRLREQGYGHMGIVYNWHHGHGHILDWADSLALMKPYLLCLNLNGMNTGAQPMILPLGLGEHDLAMLKVVVESGYDGPIGILNHTDLDAEARLRDNLDGLAWLVRQLDGSPPAPRPKYRTWSSGPPANQRSAVGAPTNSEPTALAPIATSTSAEDEAGSATAVPAYDPQFVASLVVGAGEQGAAERGIAVFAAATSACLSCHKIGNHGGSVGPELTKIGRERTPQQIVESVFWPKREVKPEFTVVSVLMSNGRAVRGYQVPSDAQSLSLKDPATGETVTLSRDEVDDQIVSGTLMPEGLTVAMSRQQQLDVIRFLTSLGQDDGPAPEIVDTLLAHATAHVPAKFDFDRAPLQPEDWPHWQHPVNRDRVYDFYTKQAEFFRGQHPLPTLLAEFPGMDGGKFGHWGNQDENTWAGDAWNQAQLGTVQCGVFRGAGVTVARAVCVRLGTQGELAACFNPDTLTYDAVWTGGFVKFSTVRHGFLHGLLMDGTPQARPPMNKPDQSFVYRGFYRNGNRVVFAYRIGDTEYLDAPWVEDGRFVRTVAPADEHPLKHYAQPGPPQWPQRLETKIVSGTGHPYAVDTIELPLDNPWRTPLFCGDHDFLPDGSALVCTMQGDVWQVTGLTDGSSAKTGPRATAVWRRFASGLHHALGLVVTESGVFVQGRDQITRLHDLNDDGEADFYECFSNAYITSTAGHDFICGLQRDSAGYFYTASGNQGVVRISPDGRRADVIATGFRNPDGIGLSPDGFVTVPSSEGEWIPASMICEVLLPGTEIGNPAPYFGYGGPRDGQAPDLPLVYLPRGLDNSSGGQVFVSSDRWGPLGGQMLHFSFGAGSHFLLLRDTVAGQSQGAVVPLPGEFLSGAHRGRFNPRDGQLYVSGMGGWGTYTPDAGCFQRVRYTGEPVQLPVAFHVYENGVTVTCTGPLDAATAERPESHFAQCWNYRYSGAYGSPEYSSRQVGLQGHDVLPIRSAHVLPDGRTLFLELPDLQPVNQLHLRLHAGQLLRPAGADHPAQDGVDLFLTVHRLDEPFTQFPGYQAVPKTIAPHPILADLALATRRVPNPWQKRVANARTIRVETGKNLTFATQTLTVRAGEPIQFTLVNPDVVPHNWVLARPGTLRAVGEASNRLVADPDAFARHYVPQTDDVLYYTDIVSPGSDFTIYFRAPQNPGRYPYLCTFPGHWMVMNGELIVE